MKRPESCGLRALYFFQSSYLDTEVERHLLWQAASAA
jgi:hypothetical protein